MERFIYNQLLEIEDHHWWFCARRKVAEYVLKRGGILNGARVLDVGCGGGGNLKMLSQFGKVLGCEYDDAMRAHAQNRGVTEVRPAHLPEQLPFPGDTFDLITMFDVLEHVDEDEESLRALRSLLAPGGKLLLTVPAFMSLWSHHDVNHHHKRRYRRKQLIRLLERSGFEVLMVNYFNFLLFPALFVLRKIFRVSKEESLISGAPLPPKPLNKLLYWMVSAERFLYPIVRLPFGSTLIVLAQKPMTAA